MTMILRPLLRRSNDWRRAFSSTAVRREILDAESLPDRIIPRYKGICLLDFSKLH
jgi:NADH kinase